MDIGEFLAPSDVFADLRAPDKTRLLQELCGRASLSLNLDSARIAEKILAREELGSTGVGDGVAIPHARLEGLKRPFGMLARLRGAIDFQAIDDQPVDIVFLLLLPASPKGEQLNALAAVARRLRDPSVARDVRRAADNARLYQTVLGEAAR